MSPIRLKFGLGVILRPRSSHFVTIHSGWRMPPQYTPLVRSFIRTERFAIRSVRLLSTSVLGDDAIEHGVDRQKWTVANRERPRHSVFSRDELEDIESLNTMERAAAASHPDMELESQAFQAVLSPDNDPRHLKPMPRTAAPAFAKSWKELKSRRLSVTEFKQQVHRL